MKIFHLFLITCLVNCYSPLYAIKSVDKDSKIEKQKVNLMKQSVDKILNVNSDIFLDEGVVKASFPRKDVTIQLSKWRVDPFIGFTSWVAFQQGTLKETMMMGDLVLFEDEVSSIMDIALAQNIQITALHNHFFSEKPRVMFMHINAEGRLKKIAQAVQKIMIRLKEIRRQQPQPKNAWENFTIKKNAIDGKRLEKIFGVKGQSQKGMFKITVGRTIRAGCGCSIGKNMGINTWASFTGTMEQGFVDGDFAVLEDELQRVLKVLRKGDIHIVAIHNHMIHEQPRMIFVHYMGQGNVIDLAKSIKRGIL